MAIKKINNTTYKTNNLGDIKPNIVIGGSDKSKFIPNINMSFHNDEFFLNLNRRDRVVSNENSALVEGKISQKINKETDEYYIKDGKLKWDILFDECPKSMEIDFDIFNSKDLVFTYQDTLENDLKNGKINKFIYDHSTRSDEIVGSYEVSCNKRNNKYKTGKLCHITRPFVIDNNGKTEWCILNISDGVLKITLPEVFMSNAVYPVRLDPNFGYETKGGTALNAGNNVFFTKYTSNGVGDVTSISPYVHTDAATAFKVALYSAPVADVVTLRTGSSEQTESSYDNWRSVSVSSYTITNSTVYSLALVSSDDDCTFYYDAGDANQEGSAPSTDYSTAWKATDDCTFPSALKFSIYATYSSGGTTYPLTYNGNGNTGGTVPIDTNSPYASGTLVTVLGNSSGLIKTGYTWNNWNTASGGIGTSYSAGNTFNIYANTTLYAQWSLSSLASISSISDSTLKPNQTGVVITGTNFGSTSGIVQLNSLSNGSGTLSYQTVTSWTSGSITFTVNKGSLNYGTNYLIAQSSNGFPIFLTDNVTTPSKTVVVGGNGTRISASDNNAGAFSTGQSINSMQSTNGSALYNVTGCSYDTNSGIIYKAGSFVSSLDGNWVRISNGTGAFSDNRYCILSSNPNWVMIGTGYSNSSNLTATIGGALKTYEKSFSSGLLTGGDTLYGTYPNSSYTMQNSGVITLYFSGTSGGRPEIGGSLINYV